MKKAIRILALVMAMLLAVGVFAACGESGGSGDKVSDGGESVKGETKTWGNITVLVPEGMTLKGGNILDENDPDVVNISKTDNAMNYFLITVDDDEEDAKGGIDSTREINSGCEDVTVEAGGKTWKGVKYQYSGNDVFQIYATVDGRVPVVQCYGFAPDSDTSKAILASLKIAAKAD